MNNCDRFLSSWVSGEAKVRENHSNVSLSLQKWESSESIFYFLRISSSVNVASLPDRNFEMLYINIGKILAYFEKVLNFQIFVQPHRDECWRIGKWECWRACKID